MKKIVSSLTPLVPIIAILGIVLLLAGAYLLHAFGFLFGMVGLPQGELLADYTSPDGHWTLSIYKVGGHATVDYSIRGYLTDNTTQRSRNIYWNYHESEADITWLDKDTVRINGTALDVRTDTYDWRLK